MSPNSLSYSMRPFLLVLVGMVVLSILYSYVSNDDYEDDDFSVTLTYSCDRVLTERNYPPEVLSMCLDLRDEIKRRNNK